MAMQPRSPYLNIQILTFAFIFNCIHLELIVIYTNTYLIPLRLVWRTSCLLRCEVISLEQFAARKNILLLEFSLSDIFEYGIIYIFHYNYLRRTNLRSLYPVHH
ncbi:putative protein orph-M5 [Microplitis demolitor]